MIANLILYDTVLHEQREDRSTAKRERMVRLAKNAQKLEHKGQRHGTYPLVVRWAPLAGSVAALVIAAQLIERRMLGLVI